MPLNVEAMLWYRQRGLRTLVVVGEVDVLLTRDQAVLYNLFEWPLRPGSRLAAVAISNTHDLDERVLTRIARCAPVVPVRVADQHPPEVTQAVPDDDTQIELRAT